MKFYTCRHCGNIIKMVKDSGVVPFCCGEKMFPIQANSVDASKEKHVPDIKVDGRNIHVQVGSVIHPMTPEHFIEWIVITTNKGSHKKKLTAGDEPVMHVELQEGEVMNEVYAYCNLHGLWKKGI